LERQKNIFFGGKISLSHRCCTTVAPRHALLFGILLPASTNTFVATSKLKETFGFPLSKISHLPERKLLASVVKFFSREQPKKQQHLCHTPLSTKNFRC
jgi:hypothetical protein